jgi:hypothetical protein
MATLPRPAEPTRSPSLELVEPATFPAKPKRLLDVSDVAEWLGVSERFANHRSVTGGRAAEGCDSSQVTDLPLVGQPIG